MEVNIASIYGYLLIIFGLVLALYSQLKSISSSLSKTKDGISSIKWSQYAWFSFFTLTLMGTLVHFLDIFQIVNYRLWIWDISLNLSNWNTIIFDIAFITLCFISLMTSIRKVGMVRGKFSLSPDSKLELFFVLFGHPAFTPLFLLVAFVVGVSFVLIGLFLFIQVPLSFYIIKYGKTN